MKYNPENYDIYLKDDMQKVEDAYEEYKVDENNKKNYFELKKQYIIFHYLLNLKQ